MYKKTAYCKLRRTGVSWWFLSLLFAIWSSGVQPADAAQFTLVDEVITMTSSNNGFYFWHDTLKGPSSWTSPDDFYNGQIYCRIEILEKATNTPFAFSFCFWGKDGTENASWELARLGGVGSVATFNSSPSSYWTPTKGGVDFSNENNFLRWGLPTWVELSPTSKILLAPYPTYSSNPTSATYWAQRDNYFPLKARVQIEAVSLGSTFAGFPVPEPSSFALLAAGLMGVAIYAWQRK